MQRKGGSRLFANKHVLTETKSRSTIRYVRRCRPVTSIQPVPPATPDAWPIQAIPNWQAWWHPCWLTE